MNIVSIMSKVKSVLHTLPQEQKDLFLDVFGGVDPFYEVVYLIVKNEHVVETEKLEKFEDRLQIIREIKKRVELLLSSYGLLGKDLVADIASEYFEDYVNYKETALDISDETFISIVKRISQLENI